MRARSEPGGSQLTSRTVVVRIGGPMVARHDATSIGPQKFFGARTIACSNFLCVMWPEAARQERQR